MNILIIEPFNAVYIGLFAATVLFGYLFIRINKNKTPEKKKRAVIILYAFVTVGFFVYKYFLSFDTEYALIRIAGGYEPFAWATELPLQLCNINMFLIIIGLLLNSRIILSFNFFTSAIGALMALLMPMEGFTKYSLLLPRVMGYFGIHWLIVLEMPILYALDLYKPKFKDIPKTLGMILAVVAVMTGLDLALVKSGIAPGANYFFTMGPEGNPILEIFYNLIKIPGLYLLPLIVVPAVYMLLVTWILGDKKKKD